MNKNREKAFTISLIKIIANLFSEKKTTFAVVASTELKYLPEHTSLEKWLLSVDFSPNGVGNRIEWLKNKPKHFDLLYGDLEHYSDEYIKNIFTPISNINTRRGRANVDYHSEYLNITNGFRHTIGQPKSYNHSIFVVGASGVYSYGSEDKHTLSSFMQQYINNSQQLHNNYAVFNLGARGAPKFVDFYKLLHLKTAENDIVILQGIDREIIAELFYLKSHQFHPIIPDLSHSANEEIFFDSAHVTYKGHQIIAEQICNSLFVTDSKLLKTPSHGDLFISEEEKIESLVFLKEFTTEFTDIYSNLEIFPELKEYLAELKQLACQNGYNGAIVVNCNPFTLGHRHLIEYAANKVDHLYIFVVEENLSSFDFITRFHLVVKGLEDLPNITILRSGKFIMSTTTYPEYFSKNELKNTHLDASTDMDIFGEYIASILNIKMRFVGEEPFCVVTAEHNKQMQNILPTYGIHVEEVKRKMHDSQVISASLVREFLQNGQINKIQNLVPSTTFEYLNSK